MPVVNQVNVRLLVNSKPLAEYQDPKGVPETHRQTHRYVEVKTGQEFQVQIRLLPGFKLQWAEYIYYTCHIDQNAFFRYKRSRVANLKHRKGILSQSLSSEVEGMELRNDQTGAWEWCPHAFGALGIAESDHIDDPSKIRPEDVRAIGSIRVTLYRATAVEKDVPIYFEGKRGFIPDELPEELLKGLDVKNNVKFHNGTPCNAPPAITHDFIPLPGLPGEKYTFNIFYRSRKCLQNLGCIPRSPSPPPHSMLMLERTEDMLKLSKQREREGNLRILRLQEQLERASTGSRNNSVKPESLDGGTLTEGRSRSATVDLTESSIKDEPDVEAIDNPMADGSTQRPRPIPPLFSATTAKKRAREEGNDSGEAVTKRARLETEAKLPSVEGQAAAKRKRVEEEADEDDLVELPPPPKRARVVEVVDLTDD